MKNRQLEHHEVKFYKRNFPIIVICEDITSPENIGMIFRICEAMGVKKIIFKGNPLESPNRKIEKISRSTVNKVSYVFTENITEEIALLKKDNFEIYALEVTESSKDLSRFEFIPGKKYVIIIGSEKKGVSPEILATVQGSIAISLFGSNTSINVVTALSIALYEITKQLNI